MYIGNIHQIHVIVEIGKFPFNWYADLSTCVGNVHKFLPIS